MSWQDYVDNNLVGSGKFAKAAIIGHGRGVWASSRDFNVSDEEQLVIISGFEKMEKFQSNGVKVNNEKFFFLNCTERSVYSKKQLDGLVIVKTKLAYLIGVYRGPVQAPEAALVIEGLADYLIPLGY